MPKCQREGEQCPCEVNGENLALDEELSEQVDILRITLSIHEATMDAHALKEPFEQLGIYKDIFSYHEILTTWNQYKALKKPPK